MLNIYTEKYTPRLKYIGEHLFRHILRMEVTFLKNLEEAQACTEPLICYSRETRLPNAINICPHGLLFQSDIRQQDIEVTRWNDTFIFFQTGDGKYDIPFDPFSAAFYLLSRYEEYDAPLDSYGRYMKENSVAYKNGFLERPVVDEWAYRIEDALMQKFGIAASIKLGYRMHSSVVIANLFKYRHCSITSNAKALMKNLFSGRFKEFKEQFKILLCIEDDPYNNLKDIVDFHNQVNLTPSFFIMVKKGEKNCRNIYSNFSTLAKALRRSYVTGLYPSFESEADTNKLSKELHFLEKKIVKNRVNTNLFFHLKYNLPKSYESLIKIGICDDFSMGYHDAIGFRAGTCTPFRFYDLKHESKTRLYVHSLAFNDRAIRNMGLHHDNMAEAVMPVIENVKAVNGQLCSAISNRTLSNTGRWKGWKEAYTFIYRYASLLESHDKKRAEYLAGNI